MFVTVTHQKNATYIETMYIGEFFPFNILCTVLCDKIGAVYMNHWLDNMKDTGLWT